VAPSPRKPSSLLDTRVIYCGDNLEQLRKLPDACVDLIYIDPPFNSNRNYEVFWGETKEKRSFDDRHESTQAYIEFMRPRCIELARVLKKTGSFYYHCDWHASHYVKVMLDQLFGESNFKNEIVWRRTSAHNDPRKYGNIHDTILFYTGSKKEYTWNPQYTPYTEEYIDSEWQELPSGEFFIMNWCSYSEAERRQCPQVRSSREWHRQSLRPASRLGAGPIDSLHPLTAGLRYGRDGGNQRSCRCPAFTVFDINCRSRAFAGSIAR
jgi:DNA modification methylase